MKDLKKIELKGINAKIKRDKEYRKKIDELYSKNIRTAQKEIERIVLKSSGDKIDINNLKKRAYEEDVDSLEEDFEEYQDQELNYYEKEQIKNTKINKRMSKLEYLYAFALLRTFKNSRQEEKNLEKHLRAEVKEERKRLEEDYEFKRLALPPDFIERFFKESRFSDRIWANQQDLVADLKKGIRRTIYKGENPYKWSKTLEKNLKKTVDNYTYAARRIAVTETAKIQIAYQIDSFKENGYTKMMWVCEPTACNHCMPYNGEVFDIDSDHDVPPMHPFCECSLAPVHSE
ncbi:minor capsid protein [Peptoniphilus catoniae]|uniref:minor capsid protein n=1 Tax=Peptoniphilus catoniae TaxID=1660341 RepID=UPI0015D618A9|nr:minor capsid protein [Peptoniphilus catoniae]